MFPSQEMIKTITLATHATKVYKLFFLSVLNTNQVRGDTSH